MRIFSAKSQRSLFVLAQLTDPGFYHFMPTIRRYKWLALPGGVDAGVLARRP